jgi:hypothetical protein
MGETQLFSTELGAMHVKRAMHPAGLDFFWISGYPKRVVCHKTEGICGKIE